MKTMPVDKVRHTLSECYKSKRSTTFTSNNNAANFNSSTQNTRFTPYQPKTTGQSGQPAQHNQIQNTSNNLQNVTTTTWNGSPKLILQNNANQNELTLNLEINNALATALADSGCTAIEAAIDEELVGPLDLQKFSRATHQSVTLANGQVIYINRMLDISCRWRLKSANISFAVMNLPAGILIGSAGLEKLGIKEKWQEILGDKTDLDKFIETQKN